VQASNPESTDRVELDAAGRPLRTVTTRAGVTYTVENAFDARGLRTGLSVTGPWSGAHTAGFRYNARMQLDTLIDFGGGRTVIEHDQDGLEVMRTLPSGVWISGGHTSLHTPTDVHYAHLSLYGPLDSRFGYDANGLVAARLTPYSDYQGSGDLVREYSYDRLGRLLGFSDEAFYDQDQVCPGGQDMDPDNGACVPAGTSQFFGALSYTYDKVGNRTDGGAVIETGNRLTQFNGYALQYDADGNLVQKSRTVPAQFNQVLYWNSLGELEGATTNGVGVSYGYDGFGRRVRRSGGPEGTVRYLYDGDDLLMELDGAGSVLREYTYYPGVDNPHSVRVWANGAGGVVYHYAMEHPGHVAGLIGPGNQLAAQYEYAPWGESEYAAGVQQPLRYMARELDPGTQLYYVRNRWYDPALARFVSEDPIGLEGGINPYVYAGNSPTNATDPFGLCVVFKGATDKDHARVNKGLDEYCPIGLEVITATSRSGGRGWSGYFTAYSGTYFAANPVGRGEGGGGGGQERIKMYIEFEQFRDNELAERFIGCKEKYYISAEYGGIYGEWYMYRTDTELQIFSFHTMSVNRKVWYAGQVYTEEYGTHQARGWVNCTTGGVKWTTPPFFVTLSPP
jgi:RHS repeat-associated protein